MKLLSSALLFLGCAASAIAAADSAASSPAALPRATPESQGVASAALLQFIEAAETKKVGLHSVMLLRHGRVVLEGWWAPHASDRPHELFSLTKSFTSTAVGFAVAEGKLDLDDPVLKFFPEDAPKDPGEHLRAMRVRHLLTMSTGHRKADIDSFPYRALPFFPAKNLVKEFFEMPVVDPPGTKFIYDSAGSHMLSEIVFKVTGRTSAEYLRTRLFDPLGIERVNWAASANGVPFGGSGLQLRTEDIARFGQLYLQKGQWQGKRLLPASWVEMATSKQIANGTSPEADRLNDWGQGYGFQFWMCRHGFYRGDGARGQFCIVMPQHDAVVAITADAKEMSLVMNLVWEQLVPALGAAALPEDPANAAKLTAKLKSLKLE